MTRNHITGAAILALVASIAGAQGVAKVPVSPDSKLWIDGTSNLHDWSCKATQLDAAIELDATAAARVAVAAPNALKRVEVKVPVRSLKCNHGGMDGNVYKALKADDAPEISYIMASFDVTPAAADSFVVHATGTLTIAGKQNKVDMDVTATRLTDGTVKAAGVVPIKMTDYGIKPPTAIFGRLKTGDEVKVNFELNIGAKAIAAAVSGER